MDLSKNKTIGIMVLVALIVLVVLVVLQFTTKETVALSDGKTGVVTKKYFSFKK